MSRPIVDLQQQQQRRELRLRIGRLRRRIDGRIRAAGHHAQQLVSWRDCVKRYPGYAVAAAFGIGLAASAGLKLGRIRRWLTARLLQNTVEQIGRQLYNELKQLWTDSTPGTKPAKNTGADDDRT